MRPRRQRELRRGKRARASNPADENSRKAKGLIEQAIAALGGETYLNIRDREQQGRGYGFHHGRAEGGGNVFWDFIEFPDKERVEITKERDIARALCGQQGMGDHVQGPASARSERSRSVSSAAAFFAGLGFADVGEHPGVILLYEGNSIAAQHPAHRVTLINAQNESITLYFDEDTHLPVKKIVRVARSGGPAEESGRRDLRELSVGVRNHGTLQCDALFQWGHGEPAVLQFCDHQSGARRCHVRSELGLQP